MSCPAFSYQIPFVERVEMPAQWAGWLSGMGLQILTNDRPNPNPATNQDITQRSATPAMYNCTRY